MPTSRRWGYKAGDSAAIASVATSISEAPCPPPEVPQNMKAAYQARAKMPSYILQHYHSTGCAGGAFSWRAAMMDPDKGLVLCTEPREYKATTLADIQYSKDDKRRGGGPRVGPFQESIPGAGWKALPKYDLETHRRSSAFNERMHVEWENHVDHILANGGKLPTASVVAKAGFRSCSPCCRDMLALARPTGKTFIMVDLAEDDTRGTFHFVTGDKYLPVPKEALEPGQVHQMKKIVAKAQDDLYESSQAIYNAVVESGVPIDEQAQDMYLSDIALMPPGIGANLKGMGLLKVLHAEHFARLTAEYGASILRDERTRSEIPAVLRCRGRAKQLLIDAWKPHLTGVMLEKLSYYADAAVSPLLPERLREYMPLKHAAAAAMKMARQPKLTASSLRACGLSPDSAAKAKSGDVLSVADASTAVPDDKFSDTEELEGGF